MRFLIASCLLLTGCDRYQDCAATPIWTADINAYVTKRRPAGGVVALGEDAVAIDDSGAIISRVSVEETSRDIAVADDGSIAAGYYQHSVYDSSFDLRYAVTQTAATPAFDLGPSGNLAYMAGGGIRFLETDGKARWATTTSSTHVRVSEDDSEVFVYHFGEFTRLSAADGAVLASHSIANTTIQDTIAISRHGEVAIAEHTSSDFNLEVSLFEPTGRERWSARFRVLGEPIYGITVTPSGDVVFAALFATGTMISGVAIDGPGVVRLAGETGDAVGAEGNCHVAVGFTAVDDAYFTNVDFQLAKFALP